MILYAGGIMVLFVFVIMLVNLDVALHQVQFNRQWLAGIAAGAGAGRGARGWRLPSSRAQPVRVGEPAPASALEPSTRAGGVVAVPHIHAAV